MYKTASGTYARIIDGIDYSRSRQVNAQHIATVTSSDKWMNIVIALFYLYNCCHRLTYFRKDVGICNFVASAISS